MKLSSVSLIVLIAVAVVVAQDTEVILGPDSAADQPQWLDKWTQYRQQMMAGFDDSAYRIPSLQWAPRNYVSPQVMIHDRYLYDPAIGWTVDRFLDDVNARYGGVNSVLLWHSYPNIGVDNRNQFQMFLDMPGGAIGVTAMIEQFHKRGVKVLFPYNPWDQGTHNEGMPDWQILNLLLADVGADGFNGDTMREISIDFWDAAIQLNHPIAIQPEIQSTFDELNRTLLGWGYWPYPFNPPVDLMKWLERKHMTTICNRWATNHTSDLQFMWFNGCGFVSWENVWGVWNGIVPRDAEALRRLHTMSEVLSDVLMSEHWTPYDTVIASDTVFASQWVQDNSSLKLWTVVNRGWINETALKFTSSLVDPQLQWWDVYHGRRITSDILGQSLAFEFDIEAGGFAAFLVAHASDLPVDFADLCAAMAALTKQPLSAYSSDPVILQQSIVPIAKTAPAAHPAPGMVYIPAIASYQFISQGIEIEHGLPYVDFQYPWESQPQQHHNHTMAIEGFYMDSFPVTNADFWTFMQDTHYQPQDTTNFLKDWSGGRYPQGWDNKPVTWVSLSDARAYATWAGKRLPHEWEWQYAAQGAQLYLYPWGNTFNASMVPQHQNGRDPPPPAAVNDHVEAASPFDVVDLMMNVWQWTDEYFDEHTRAACLKGGSYYRPSGSGWYFPAAQNLQQHGKLLLVADGLDRSAMIGFRCVKDIATV